MDIIDEAQGRTEYFTRLAMQNRAFDLAPLPPQKTNAQGQPLCIGCDIDITLRRRIVPNAQRCIDCQQEQELIEKRSRGK
jgi:RNA polymerase-binding transcription factor DksA